MNDLKKLFGIRIKALREKRGWTQENLAERIDISSNYLSSIERGKENPTFDMLERISSALDVEIKEIFDFGHEVTQDELRKMLNKFAREANEEELRLAIKILRAVTR